MTGTLRVCGTPIGNLGDVTPRVLEALAAAAAVACEDTRRTGALLHHFGIKAPLVRLDEHEEARRAPELVARLVAGEDLCLVSDAGLPGVSDPGRVLVRAALAAGVRVEVLPGPSAVTTALVASGLVADRFGFVGFLPRAAGELARCLDELDAWRMPVVAFEAPSRLPRTLAAIAARAPDREVAVTRELTKLHEEVVRGTAAELAVRFAEAPRGEIAIVLGPLAAASPDLERAQAAVRELRAAGLGAKQASALVAGLTGLPRRSLYEA